MATVTVSSIFIFCYRRHHAIPVLPVFCFVLFCFISFPPVWRTALGPISCKILKRLDDLLLRDLDH